MPDRMTYHDRLIEAGARAIAEDTPSWTGEHWDEDRRLTVREFLERTHMEKYIDAIARDAARAALSAFLTILKEPSDAMIAAAWEHARADDDHSRLGDEPLPEDAWQCMLSAISDEG